MRLTRNILSFWPPKIRQSRVPIAFPQLLYLNPSPLRLLFPRLVLLLPPQNRTLLVQFPPFFPTAMYQVTQLCWRPHWQGSNRTDGERGPLLHFVEGGHGPGCSRILFTLTGSHSTALDLDAEVLSRSFDLEILTQRMCAHWRPNARTCVELTREPSRSVR